MTPRTEGLSTTQLASLLATQTSTDLQAIDALTLSERQWLESAIRKQDKGSNPLLLGAIRLKQRYSLKPCYAQSHLKSLSCWVSFAASRPVNLGIAA